jgi:hypothetical protein
MGRRIPRHRGRRDAARVVLEQRYAWGWAYRNGRQVCGRVSLTILRDARLGLATGHARRHIAARFEEGIDPELRDELERLASANSADAKRIAERLRPLSFVVENHRGRLEIQGFLQPPVSRGGPLSEIEYRVRER